MTEKSEINTGNAEAASQLRPDRSVAQPAKAEWRIDIVDSVQELFTRRDDLKPLAASALEPNVFHEPFLLFPALKAFAGDMKLRFVLVYGTPGGNPKPPMTLRVFLPLVRVKRHRGLPVSALRSWTYIHCFLGTPLVHSLDADESVDVLFDWLRDDSSAAPILEIPLMGLDGPVFQHFTAQCHRRQRPIWLADVSGRAICKPTTDTFQYIRNAMSGQAHKDFKRKQRRLAELGYFEYRYYKPGDDLDAWCEDFLAVEGSGWKGEAGSALGASEANREFFHSVVKEAAAENRLMMLAMSLGGKPIAVKCNFLAKPGAFAFKIGFDESYKQYSPGQILELENIRAMCEDKPAAWMDSCAAPDHPMINRLWTERRTLGTLHIATGKRLGDLTVSALPMLKWLQRKVRRK